MIWRSVLTEFSEKIIASKGRIFMKKYSERCSQFKMANNSINSAKNGQIL